MTRFDRITQVLPQILANSNLGGATQLFLGGCVPRGFQNVGSREPIFLKKNGGLGNENFEKVWSRELEFWPKHGWKCKNFLKIENRGHESGTMTVNWWARERRLAWKKGIMTAAHPHTPFQCECPPPGILIHLVFSRLTVLGVSTLSPYFCLTTDLHYSTENRN